MNICYQEFSFSLFFIFFLIRHSIFSILKKWPHDKILSWDNYSYKLNYIITILSGAHFNSHDRNNMDIILFGWPSKMTRTFHPSPFPPPGLPQFCAHPSSQLGYGLDFSVYSVWIGHLDSGHSPVHYCSLLMGHPCLLLSECCFIT